MVSIPPGTKLTFRDDPELVCEVVSQRRVLFEGEEKTLTAAAQALLSQDERYGDWVRRGNVHGTKYWYLDGESVWDRRMRMESEG